MSAPVRWTMDRAMLQEQLMGKPVVAAVTAVRGSTEPMAGEEWTAPRWTGCVREQQHVSCCCQYGLQF